VHLHCSGWSQRLAFLNAIADALVKLQTDSVIDGVFLFLATPQEWQAQCRSLAVGAGDVAGGRTGNIHMKAGFGQAMRFIDNAVVTALQAKALLNFCLACPLAIMVSARLRPSSTLLVRSPR